jgi:hypothetical protein
VRFIILTLLTETRVNVEEYGRYSAALVPLTAAGCECQTDTEGTGGNGHDQPQAVAERRDVAIPSQSGVVG